MFGLSIAGWTLAPRLVSPDEIPGSFIHVDLEVRFDWRKEVKTMEIINRRTGREVRDANLTEHISREAELTISQFVGEIGLEEAEGKIYGTLKGYEAPFLIVFGEKQITRPKLGLLFHAAQTCDESILSRLLSEAMEINLREHMSGRTPLQYAASGCGASFINMMLEAGADPNSSDLDGLNPLMMASHAGKLEVVEALLEAGADVEARTKSGHTAVSIAERKGHKRVSKLLRKYQAEKD